MSPIKKARRSGPVVIGARQRAASEGGNKFIDESGDTYQNDRCMAEIVPFTLTAHRAQALIRELAADSARVVVISHGKKRQRERGVSHKRIIDCLMKGTITEGPYQIASGDWRCNVSRHAAGERLTCVVQFDWPQRLLVVTVFER